MAKKKDRLPPFVALPWELLNSQVYIALPPSASKALSYFFGKVKRTWNDPARYSEIFTFSYPEGKRLGFAYGTFARAIEDLIKHGFITLVEKGGLRGKGKGYNKYRLSNRWKDYGSEKDPPYRGQLAKAKRTPSDMAIYRIPSKNGNVNGAENAPTTPNLEMKTVSDAS